jgi:hypothetical protein
MLTKYLSTTTIKQQTGTGFKKYQKAIWTDGEKFYVLASGTYSINTIEFDGKEYIEVEKVLDSWYVK